MNTKRIFAAGLVALTVGAALTTTSTEASAKWGKGWGYAVGAGVVGGLALGALAASGPAYAAPAYAPPAYGPAPVYYGGCGFQKQPMFNAYGTFIGYHTVKVCY